MKLQARSFSVVQSFLIKVVVNYCRCIPLALSIIHVSVSVLQPALITFTTISCSKLQCQWRYAGGGGEEGFKGTINSDKRVFLIFFGIMSFSIDRCSMAQVEFRGRCHTSFEGALNLESNWPASGNLCQWVEASLGAYFISHTQTCNARVIT